MNRIRRAAPILVPSAAGPVLAALAIAQGAAAACPSFGSATTLFFLTDNRMEEVSGMVSMAAPLDGFWVHNDSGGDPIIFGVNSTGTVVAAVTLAGASNDDWEDIAVGPGPVAGTPYIYIADTGDNDLDRDDPAIYRLAQPALATVSAAAQKLDVRYPGGISEDCETLLSDPTTGDLFLVSRDRAGAGVFRVYRFPFPHATAGTTTLTLVAEVASPGALLAKGGDFSSDGSEIAIIFHDNSTGTGQIRIWPRAEGQSVGDAFAQQACTVAIPSTPQSEALCHDASGNLFFTSEGENQPVRRLLRAVPPASTWTVR